MTFGRKNFSLYFFCGVFVGLVELVPGISGATIILLFGLYDRLLALISKISFSSFIRAISGKIKIKDIVHSFDLLFLFFLLLGNLVSLFLFSNLFSYLMTHYYKGTLSIFSGIILWALGNFLSWKTLFRKTFFIFFFRIPFYDIFSICF